MSRHRRPVCCKIVSVLGPVALLRLARLGEPTCHPYKGSSAIPVWEDRMAVFNIVVGGREA